MPEATSPPRPSDLGITERTAAAIAGTFKTAQEPSLGKATRPIEILEAMTSKFGPEWLEWEPETLWTEIRRAWNITPNDILKAKVHATKALLTTDAFWRDHMAFEKMAMAFNNHVAMFGQYQNPSPAMLANAIEEALKVRLGRFSDDVLRYIAVVCFQDGLVVLPEPLDAAQGSLDALTAPVVGRQLREDLARRWKEISLNGAPEGVYIETVTGIHLAKMAAIREYVRSF